MLRVRRSCWLCCSIPSDGHKRNRTDKGGGAGWEGVCPPPPASSYKQHAEMALSPPKTEGLKGYKVQISSLSQLARVHLSVYHSCLQAICLYLFINPSQSLFIAAILFHKVFAEAQICRHTHIFWAPVQGLFVFSQLWHLLNFKNMVQSRCDTVWRY